MAIYKSGYIKILGLFVFTSLFLFMGIANSQNNAVDPLPSWNNSPAKTAIINFVRITTDKSNPNFVPIDQRIATFDQDGTTWVEYPLYTQLLFILDQVRELAPKHPDWYTTEPFKSVLTGNRKAIANFTEKDIQKIVNATQAGMSVYDFQITVNRWLLNARNPHWQRPYTDLVYQPMLEVMRYLRANGYKTYIVTGGGQDFVRTYAQQIYGIPPEQIIGSAFVTQYQYENNGQSVLMRTPKLLLNNNFSGKPENIYLMIGRRPVAAFGNSTGDEQMLEFTQGGSGARLMMLVLHDDPDREFAYGPASGLPKAKVGVFTQALYDEAKKNGWIIISMKNDWKRIFPFDK